jgi:hypothetical protein
MSPSQPYDYKIYGFTFLDRSSVLFYGTSDIEQILRLQVVTFDSESRNTTDEAALRIYYFDVDALGPKPKPTEFLSSNTLPSNTPGSCFPGLFHSEPSSRLLALEVVIDTDPIWGGGVPRVLYVPHDVFLGHIRSYPSDSHPVVVPWKARGPGNAHILASPHLRPKRVEFAGRKIVCGMHATTEPPMVIGEGDQKIVRIMDYHPRRIYRNSITSTQSTHLRGAADSHKGLGTPGISAQQDATDENIPYALKDIPLPGGLRSKIKCVLGEDVVAVLEVGIPSLLIVLHEGIHSVQVFCWFDCE